jgi:hypothetical protein
MDLDVSAKFLLFRVGFQGLRADFVTVRDSTQRGWSMRFNRDPEWNLPLLTERMLRTPLRRPFRGPGSHFRIVAHADPAAPQTTLSRRLLVPVEESAILRFLSRLVNTGVGDYVEGADRETNEWLAAAFAALREDARAVLDPEKTETPPR